MNLKRWLPHLVTLVFAALLVVTQQVWASPIVARITAQTTSTSKETINYQGYLTDAGGNPVNGSLDMVFRLYNLETGGTSLWSETQTGVPVTGGLFSVLLGSVDPLSRSVFEQNEEVWLGVSVGADEEMAPREKMSSAPYAFTGYLPPGVIVMWSGSLVSIPDGWALCDGTNGMPDLRDQFVVGAGNSYSVGDIGGVISVTLTVDQLPAHAHSATASIAGNHNHFQDNHTHGGEYSSMGGTGWDYVSSYEEYTSWAGAHTHDISVEETGGEQPHENRPPYYSVAFICKQ